ncbi:PilZ domain-containing protein [Clostridium sp. 19966]|uniref:PilZ domain-containing protein n=1 Tax=Clostridium sp. 19966 TaxID=2768166 RepID=UPI0028EA53F8|nr:PilZ domain-containing protein [Clostridium sp. 19966]
MSIVELDNREVKTSTSFICVKDIGIGGLRFSSKLKFPMGDSIVYQFKIPILHKRYFIKGNIVWKKEQENNEIHYGVNFIIDKCDNCNYFTLFNNLELIIKRNSKNHGCKFCDLNQCPNKL